MATQIINQPVIATEAFNETVGTVSAELAHINELADLVSECAAYGNPERLEALAASICQMTKSISSHLDEHFYSARAAVPSFESTTSGRA